MRTVKFFVMYLFVAAAMVVVLTSTPTPAAEPVKQQALVDKARLTLDNFVADPNMTWLRTHLRDVKGVLITPELLKGAFVVGGSGGSGVLLARDEKTGRWTEPAFYSMGAASLGFQIGGQAAEVILMIMNRKALESLYTSSIKLGGDFSVAAGPVGVGAATKGATAPIISYARTKGAFVGVSLEGAVVKVSDRGNRDYYGKPVRPIDIFVTRSVSNPGSAELRTALRDAERKGVQELAAMGATQFVYAKTTINIRSGPGTNNSVIRQATKGDALEYLALEGNWYKLKVAKGKPQEWVHKSVVTVSK
jgi:lipid-binding SYLF domain-containing protein